MYFLWKTCSRERRSYEAFLNIAGVSGSSKSILTHVSRGRPAGASAYGCRLIGLLFFLVMPMSFAVFGF